MKKNIIVLIIFILSATLSAQIPRTLTVRVGDSEMKGLAGLELQVSKFSISGGWRPSSTPSTGEVIHSFDVALTVYSRQWYESSWYFSVGRASRGTVYVTKLNQYSGLNEYEAEPSIIGILGYRTNFFPDFNNRFYIDTGFGYNISKHSNMFAFEIVINYALFKK